MEWPGKTVVAGGMFHPAKVQYSPETRNFLKVLMEESKLTMMQRQKINYALRSGDPLPQMRKSSATKKSPKPKMLSPPCSPRRRTYNTIVKSGAYEREKYHPRQPISDRNKSIERLQNIMFYGKDVKCNPEKMKKKMQVKREDGRQEEPSTFERLKKEIEERQYFLQEMEKLGEDHKYRHTINQQITVILKEIEKLNLNCANMKH